MTSNEEDEWIIKAANEEQGALIGAGTNLEAVYGSLFTEEDKREVVSKLVSQMREDIVEYLIPFLGEDLYVANPSTVLNTDYGLLEYYVNTGSIYLNHKLIEDEELYHCLLMFITNNHHENGTRISSI